jgi:hypothetical protein
MEVKFTLRILAKIHVGSETGSGSETNRKIGSRSGSEKNHSGSTTLFVRQKRLNLKKDNKKLCKFTFRVISKPGPGSGINEVCK